MSVITNTASTVLLPILLAASKKTLFPWGVTGPSLAWAKPFTKNKAGFFVDRAEHSRKRKTANVRVIIDPKKVKSISMVNVKLPPKGQHGYRAGKTFKGIVDTTNPNMIRFNVPAGWGRDYPAHEMRSKADGPTDTITYYFQLTYKTGQQQLVNVTITNVLAKGDTIKPADKLPSKGTAK